MIGTPRRLHAQHRASKQASTHRDVSHPAPTTTTTASLKEEDGGGGPPGAAVLLEAALAVFFPFGASKCCRLSRTYVSQSVSRSVPDRRLH